MEVARRTQVPTAGSPPELGEESWSLAGRDLEASRVFHLSGLQAPRCLCVSATGAVSAALSLLPPPPERTWPLTSDNPTTAAPHGPCWRPLLASCPPPPLPLPHRSLWGGLERGPQSLKVLLGDVRRHPPTPHPHTPQPRALTHTFTCTVETLYPCAL